MKDSSKVIKRKLKKISNQRKKKNNQTNGYDKQTYEKQNNQNFNIGKNSNKKVKKTRQNKQKVGTNDSKGKENVITSIGYKDKSKERKNDILLRFIKDKNANIKKLDISLKKRCCFLNIKFLIMLYLFITSLSIMKNERRLFQNIRLSH